MENEWRPAVFLYSEEGEKRKEKKNVKEKSCLRNSIQPLLRKRGNFWENPPLGTADGEETREGTSPNHRVKDRIFSPTFPPVTSDVDIRCVTRCKHLPQHRPAPEPNTGCLCWVLVLVCAGFFLVFFPAGV